jgi:hypothetical protein
MNIAEGRRFQKALGEIDALMEMVRVLREAITNLESRIVALEAQSHAHRPGRPARSD